MAPRSLAAALVLLLAAAARASAAPDYDPQRPGDWDRVDLAPGQEEFLPLCPATVYGVVAAVRLRRGPVPVYCLKAEAGRVALADSGYEVWPGEPARLLAAGFAAQAAAPLARLTRLDASPDPASLAACAADRVGESRADDAACARALNVYRVASWVRRAAKIPVDSVGLIALGSGPDDDGVNAAYGFFAVTFNKSFVTRFGGDDDVVAYTAAHELGHHQQFMQVKGPVRRTPLTPAETRAREAEADSRAMAILRDAGHPLERSLAGMKRLLDAVPEMRFGTHPLHATRLSNVAHDALRGDRPHKVPAAPRPRFEREEFDGQGRAVVMPSPPEASLR